MNHQKVRNLYNCEGINDTKRYEGGRQKSKSGLKMPLMVLAKIQRKPLEEKWGFFKFLEPVLQLHEDSRRNPGSVCAPDLAPETSSRDGRTCAASPTLLLRCAGLGRRSRENRAIPWNLPAQLFTRCGLLLSHELLYSKAKLSPRAEKVTGRQGPAGTDTPPSSAAATASPKGHRAAGKAFPGQGRMVSPPRPPLSHHWAHPVRGTGGRSQG